jgi:hypothetical protein
MFIEMEDTLVDWKDIQNFIMFAFVTSNTVEIRLRVFSSMECVAVRTYLFEC